MKKYLSLILLFSQITFAQKEKIDQTLNQWHQAAAQANFDAYFNIMAPKAIFIGTDATENWTKKEFEKYAKPHFDKGKAWNFEAIQRNIFISKNGKMAWFDELLNTQNMKICRGSGVLIKQKGQWKISQYVLSMTIPNEVSKEVIGAKSALEGKFLIKFKAK